MTDPITAQADLAAVIKDIRSNRVLGSVLITGIATDADLTAVLGELEPDELTVLRIHFGLGRPKGNSSEVKAAVSSIKDVRTAYQAAGNHLRKLVEARVQQRLDSEPDDLAEFEFTVRALLHNAGILCIPATGTFTPTQSDDLITRQPWARSQTISFNESMKARGDHRTLESLIHSHQLRISYVRNRVHIPG